jgi:predicted SnoaL-like aldol condensation-catalyzing enzyme
MRSLRQTEVDSQRPPDGCGAESVKTSPAEAPKVSPMSRQSHKEVAMEFLRLASAGQVREAYRRYVGPGFRHHNPFFRGDPESLMAAMEANADGNPGKVLDIQRALEDGELVAVHSRVAMKPGDRGAALVHIFRFHRDLIVEMWDIGQAVPEDSPNEHGMF